MALRQPRTRIRAGHGAASFRGSRCDIDAESVSDREPSPAGKHVFVTLQVLGPPRRFSRARVPQADPLSVMVESDVVVGLERQVLAACGSAYGTAMDTSIGRTAALRLTVIRGGMTHPGEASVTQDPGGLARPR